jgi:hypothetical protein
MNYILKNIQVLSNPKKYEVMISVSLFKMKESYRNFSSYIKNLYSWINTLSDKICVRLYVDESVLEEELFIKLFNQNIKHLEIVLYEFKDFYFDEYHDGTFGSIVRFLALFDKPHIPENIKYIWISDVDLPIYNFSYENIKDLKRNNVKIGFYSKACNVVEWVKDDYKYPINAGKIIVDRKVKFSYENFELFLNKVLLGEYEEIKNRILKNRENKSHYAPAKYFTYGFDEIYTNEYLRLDIEKYKYIIYYDISLDTLKRVIKSNSGDKLENNLENNLRNKFLELNELERQMWKSSKSNTKENKIKLRNINNEIYDMVKNFEIENTRLKICMNDYIKYNNNIDYKSYVWGLTAIVKN